MRLLVDCHCFDYSLPQGINTYIRGLYTSLIPRARNIKFYLCAADTLNLKSIFGEYDNIEYITLPHCGTLKRLLRVFPKIIKQYGIDWAHFQYTAPFVKSCRTIVTLHDILFADFPELFPLSYRISKGPLFKFSAKRADLLLTVSEYSRKCISANYGIPGDCIGVTNNAVSDVYSDIPVDVAHRFVAEKFSLDKYILYVSRIEPRKNQAHLIRTFLESGLSEKGYKLVIVGKQSVAYKDLEEINKQLQAAGDGTVMILNGIDNESLRHIYKAASLFVYPALAEGFGIPPLEAAVAGIPVICNNATAMSDFTFFGRNLIDTSDCKALKDRMIELTSLSPSIEHLNDIKAQIMAKYSWDTIADTFYKLLLSR